MPPIGFAEPFKLGLKRRILSTVLSHFHRVAVEILTAQCKRNRHNQACTYRNDTTILRKLRLKFLKCPYHNAYSAKPKKSPCGCIQLEDRIHAVDLWTV